MYPLRYRPNLESLGQRALPSAVAAAVPGATIAHRGDLGNHVLLLPPARPAADRFAFEADEADLIPCQWWGTRIAADHPPDRTGDGIDAETAILGVLYGGSANNRSDRDELLSDAAYWPVYVGTDGED
jgi:hypothetical protein